MNPIEFKLKWNPDNLLNRWWDCDYEEVAKLPVLDETKYWLKEGFPEDAAPFLNFGLRSFEGKFRSIKDCYSSYDFYELNSNAGNYWIFGSDGGGNPICIDSANNDMILLLDHEDNFSVIATLNKNIPELAICLLEYKNFVHAVNSELGNGAIIESKFTLQFVNNLKEKFEEINSAMFKTSSFWRTEIENLLSEAK